MTWVHAFVSLLFAHIIADFAVRREILKKNRKAPTQPAWQHLATFVVISLGFLIPLGPVALLLALVAAGLHYVIDCGFGRTTMWGADVGPKQRWLFVGHQVAKVLSLALVATFAAEESTHDKSIDASAAVLALPYLFAYSFAIFAGDAFVSLVLTKLDWKDADNTQSADGAGRLIGILEAVLVTTFVIGHQYSAAGLVLAAKSVARFEWLKDSQGKAEYFLVGTLANLTCSVAGGLIALWLSGRPVFSP